MNNLIEKLAILCVLILALYMRLHFMTRSFFYDELYIAVHGAQAPSLYDALFKNFSESNHLGYTALAYLTGHLLGVKEWTMRLPALLFGLGSIFIFWHWSRQYFGKTTAIIGALLLALAPAHIIWSASARGYSACIFFTILSTALYFSLLEKPSIKTAVMLTLTNIFASSFHIYFLCIFLAQLFHFLLMSFKFYTKKEDSIKKESLFYILLSIGVSILCSIFIYSHALPSLMRMAGDHRAFVPDFPMTLLNDLLSLPFWPLGVLALILMGIGLINSNKRLFHWRFYVILVFLMLFPIWFSKPVYLYPRFFAYLLPFFFLLMAHAISTIVKASPKAVRPFMITIFIGLISLIIWSWCTKPSKIVADFHYKFRESVEFAESVASPQASFCAFGNEDDFFQYYAHRPIVTFKTFEEFKSFYQQGNQIICFTMSGLPMPEEHKKIFLSSLVLSHQEKSFDNIIVFDLKG